MEIGIRFQVNAVIFTDANTASHEYGLSVLHTQRNKRARERHVHEAHILTLVSSYADYDGSDYIIKSQE